MVANVLRINVPGCEKSPGAFRYQIYLEIHQK